MDAGTEAVTTEGSPIPVIFSGDTRAQIIAAETPVEEDTEEAAG